MNRKRMIACWMDQLDGAASTAEVSEFLGLAPALVRWWASRNRVKIIGNSRVFVDPAQVEALAHDLLGDAPIDGQLNPSVGLEGEEEERDEAPDAEDDQEAEEGDDQEEDEDEDQDEDEDEDDDGDDEEEIDEDEDDAA